MFTGNWHVFTGPDRLPLPLDKTGSLISMIHMSPEATGITLEGEFKYPFRHGKISFGPTLGLSNEFHGGAGAVTLEAGTLALFIQPLPMPQVSDPDPDTLAPPENFPEPL